MSLLNIYSVKEESILIKDIPYIFRDSGICFYSFIRDINEFIFNKFYLYQKIFPKLQLSIGPVIKK